MGKIDLIGKTNSMYYRNIKLKNVVRLLIQFQFGHECDFFSQKANWCSIRTEKKTLFHFQNEKSSNPFREEGEEIILSRLTPFGKSTNFRDKEFSLSRSSKFNQVSDSTAIGTSNYLTSAKNWTKYWKRVFLGH